VGAPAALLCAHDGRAASFWSNWAWAAATAVLGFVVFALVFRQDATIAIGRQAAGA
jgi:hypothetical protein